LFGRFPSIGRVKPDIRLAFPSQFEARKKGFQCESLSEMDQLSAEMVAEFPERGMQWVKDRVEAAVSETGDYVREKPTQSLLYAFAAGYILNRLPLGRVIGGVVRLLMLALRPAIVIYGAAKLYQAAQEHESSESSHD
jgi:hypothetical protein